MSTQEDPLIAASVRSGLFDLGPPKRMGASIYYPERTGRRLLRRLAPEGAAPVAASDELLERFAGLGDELHRLAESDPQDVDTTLLIHPAALTDFLDFNDFLAVADAAVEEHGYAGILQVASFHPQFQFADTHINDVSNATNRAPFPTLHLLRESSIDRAVATFPEAETIFEANIETLEKLGADGWAALQAQCKRDAQNT